MIKRLIAALSLMMLLLPPHTRGESVSTLTVIPPRYPLPQAVTAMIDIARGELGTVEARDGSTKYGKWYGDPFAEWCAELLCWCVAQAEEELGTKLLNVQFPLYGASNTGRDWFLKQGRYIARSGFLANWGSQWYTGETTQMKKNSYIPQPGDWVFFSYSPSGDTSHAALVERSLQNSAGEVFIQVIEGNNPDRVQRNEYRLDDWRIQGYGTVFDLADIVLRGGAESKKVAALQDSLVTIGLLDENETDGVYGYATQEAVRRFQRMTGLPQTGIANQQTQLTLQEFTRRWIMEHTEFWTVDAAH